MKKTLLASPFLLALAAFAAFTPYYGPDSLTSINTTNWTQNGTLSATGTGLTSSDANGGSLISKVTPTGPSTSEYEADVTLTLTASGGTFDIYLDATSNALSEPSTPSGNYYVFELSPTLSGSTCSATLAAFKRVTGPSGTTITSLASTSVPCHNGTVVRAVRTNHSQISAYVDGVLYANISDSFITSGLPGIGVRNAPAGNTISSVSLYPVDITAPNAVNAQSVGTSPFPTRVDMQWQGVSDDANGSGLAYYAVYRGTTFLANVTKSEFSDETVAAATSYTYNIKPTDYHQNQSTTTITVQTPPSGAIDPRRVGVRPTGSYWGGAGEQVDTLSGNLNYSTQLFKAMGRGGTGVGINLSYNSQLWRQDPGGTWKLDDDVGYGLGWRLQAGALIPFYSGYSTIDHYTFIDSTGAEYRLDQNSSGIWTSLQSIYVTYNSTVTPGVLHFNDGSFWVMGATSAGTEQDAGTMYPTTMEDSNGNQIFLYYNTGLGVTFANSSARINYIEDVRAIPNPTTRQTYTFTYNTDPIPHLTAISNVLGNGSESYTLGYTENAPLASPFSNPVSFGTTTLLQSLAVTNLGYSTSFTYDATTNSGELTSMTTPFGGKIRWAYEPFTYNGTRTLREVQNRYLTTTSGTESGAYAFTRPSGDSSLSLHSGLTIDDPSGIGERAWTFATTGTTALLGTVTQYEERPSSSQANSPLKRQAYTWVQDSLGNPYIGTSLTTLDPTGANVQSKVTQTLDTHGNVTQSNTFNYGNLTTAARTYNYTYLTGSNYSSQYIFNRLVSASVTDGTHSVTLVTKTYDNQTLTNITTLNEHDSNFGTSLTARGNVTVTTPVGGPSVTSTYDITGTAVSATDSLGHTVSVTTDSTTNFTAPTAVTPNSNIGLQTTASYTQWLSPNSVTQPNSANSTTTYDTFGRPQQTKSVYGAQTTYTYSQNGTLPMVVTATTNSHWTKTTLDGFGRTVEFDRGYNSGSTSTMVSTVQTGYAPVACSPLGQVIQVSRPFAPGGMVYLTTYSYDGRGRTLNTVLPDGASTTKYTYAGNVSTVTDPAGNWKQDTYDVFGHITVVTEPNPAGGSNLTTSYTYDVMDHLTGVSMPRGSTPQTRAFTYDPTTQRLSSQTHPESGTTSYTYNADGTLQTRTDQKAQVTQWNYDTYKRVTSVQRFPTAGTEDTCQGWNFTYDGNYPAPYQLPIAQSQTNSLGRLSTFQWRGTCTEGSGFQYAYTPGGQTTYLNATPFYTYDNEGKVTSLLAPGYSTWDPARTYTYSFDLMDRPTGMTDSSSTVWIQNVQYGPSDEVLQRTRRWFNPSTGVYSTPTETRQYNALGQLTRITIPSYLDQEYVYSATKNNGRITQTIDHIANETVSYTYDSLNRLATASSSLGWGQSYTYDGFGNLTDKNQTAGSPPVLHVNVDPTTNRLSGSAYTYDANGNLTSVANSFSVTYNVDNQIYTGPANGSTVQYFYDQNNRRHWTVYPGSTFIGETYGAYGEHFQTADNQGINSAREIYFGTDPIYQQFVNSGSGYHAENPLGLDRLGSARTWGGTGTNYYAYGEEYVTTGLSDFEKFSGYIRDSSGLDNAWHRYYSNNLGRFTSPDPSLKNVSLGNPLSWNRYAYVDDDPINGTDPTGLDDCTDCTDNYALPFLGEDGGSAGGGAGDSGLSGTTGSSDDGSQTTAPPPDTPDGPTPTTPDTPGNPPGPGTEPVAQVQPPGAPDGPPGQPNSGGTGTGPMPFYGSIPIALEGAGEVICVASGVCEVVGAVIVGGAVVYVVYEIGVHFGPKLMGRVQGNQWNDWAKEQVQEKKYPTVCAALAAALAAARDTATQMAIVTAQKYANCRNRGKARR